jgi:HEAT repeat protein
MLEMALAFALSQAANAAQVSAADIKTLLSISDVVVRGQVGTAAEIGRTLQRIGQRDVEVVLLRAEAILALMKEPKGDRQAMKALRYAAGNEADAKTKWTAVELLLSLHHDISVLPMASEELMSSHPTTPDETRTVLSSAVGYGAGDPKAIPILGRMLGAADVHARMGAATALGHIGSAEAKNALVSALYDSDSEVRYDAVIGLANIAGPKEGVWCPSREQYLADESRYLTHWREWAKRK